MRELYQWGFKPLAGLTKLDRLQRRGQMKSSTWSSRLAVGHRELGIRVFYDPSCNMERLHNV